MRIVGLRLRSSAPLATLAGFYGETLGLPLLAEAPGEITFAAGETRLTFLAPESGRRGKPDDAQGGPFYHFAFNIPENKLLQAREWQLRRTPLVPPGEGLAGTARDPRYPPDVVRFPHWNAHSVFFWDPAGNLVEHIARHDLANGAAGPFSSRDLLAVSEIAFVVDDVRAAAAELSSRLEIEPYRQGSDAFMALGDERGLLLVMERGRNLGFEEGRPAGVFPTLAHVDGPAPARCELAGFPYRIDAG